MAHEIALAGRPIGLKHRPYIIAEMSGNHNGALENALRIVDAAAAAGADAIKLQTYTADTMTLDLRSSGFLIDDPNSLWSGRSLYELYREAHTPWEWHEPIFRRARSRGIQCFSTPFDDSAVTFLENLNVPAYKVASFENTDLALVRKMASTGKPLIISTGMADVGELGETVRVAREAGCQQLILLKCTSTYPAVASDSNLRTIPHLRELFGCEVGLSDHTLGIGAAIASVALGATVIEKHFTISRAEGGVDAAFSLEAAEMEMLVHESERAWAALGKVSYGPTDAEQKSLAFRRSLYVVQDISAGERLTKDNIRAIRPGFGLAPRYLDIVIGRTLNRPVARGTPLSWDLF